MTRLLATDATEVSHTRVPQMQQTKQKATPPAAAHSVPRALCAAAAAAAAAAEAPGQRVAKSVFVLLLLQASSVNLI
jgi:hypothetical protein